MGRAPCCNKANVKKGPWSPEEDAMLKEFIGKYGTAGSWISLPQKSGLRRCGKSCRLRWLNYLRPNIKHGDFSEEEDRIICTLYATIGRRWSIIASQLPGRTDNDIKNYWNTRLKKKLMGINYPSNIRKPSLPYYQNSLQPTSQFQAHTTMMPTLSQLFRDFSPFPTHDLQARPPSSLVFESSLSLQQQQHHAPMPPRGKGELDSMLAYPSDIREVVSKLTQEGSSLSLSQNCLFNSSTSPLNQYYGFEMQDGLMNPRRSLNNMVNFGGNSEAASCSSSSDGSCSKMSSGIIKEIKKESMSCLHYERYPSNGYEDEQRLILDYGATNFVNLNHELLQNYDNLEEVKELLNKSSSNNNSGNFFLNDENKTHQKTMYFD